MKPKIRGLISIVLLFSWITSAISGIVLHFAPEGQRSRQLTLLFNLSKHQWSQFHTWTSFLALGITIIHVIVDWKILLALIKSLKSK